MILLEIKTTGPHSDKLFRFIKIRFTFSTIAPVACRIRMFRFMARTDRVSIVMVVAAAPLWIGEQFAWFRVVADGTVATFGAGKPALFTAETAVGTWIGGVWHLIDFAEFFVFRPG
jgi:hypothetical protein